MSMRFEVDIETGRVRCLGIVDQDFDEPIPFDTSRKVPSFLESILQDLAQIPEQPEDVAEYHEYADDVQIAMNP